GVSRLSCLLLPLFTSKQSGPTGNESRPKESVELECPIDRQAAVRLGDDDLLAFLADVRDADEPLCSGLGLDCRDFVRELQAPDNRAVSRGLARRIDAERISPPSQRHGSR